MATASPSRPLVFISATHADVDWRDRLKAAIETDGRADWWDDSRIGPGRRWADEIQEALAGASVGVVLLSNEYLASKQAVVELATLARRASEPDGFALFPIVIHDCPWNRIDELRDVQVWAMGRPLDSLPETVLRNELKAIAADVALATQKRRSTGPQRMGTPLPESAATQAPPRRPGDGRSETGTAAGRSSDAVLHFSPTAEQIIERARALASRSGRVEVTSSCLLFALTESGDVDGSRNGTPRFLREAIERTGKYAQTLETFMGDATKQRQPSDTLEPLGAVSTNVRATLEGARSIAERTSGSRTIHARHLLAALLVTPVQGKAPIARQRLQRLGLDVGVLVRDLRGFLLATAPDDNGAAWDAILGPSSRSPSQPPPEPSMGPATSAPSVQDSYVPGPAGYTSEFVGVGGTHAVSDELGVKGSAHRLAELIALRETKMPLAIGLFADWGSGKSHFMNLIDRHLKTLAGTGAADGPWCTEIVPIYFNAWHYLDSNLWASLVTEIFDGLFRHLAPKADVLETARAQLREAGGAVAHAEEELTRARAAVTTANTALEDARRESTAAHEAARGLINNLEALVSPSTLDQTRAQLEEWLGVKAEVATLSQLVRKHHEVASVPGRVRELWRRTTAQPGRWWRLGWLAGLLVVTPTAIWIAAEWAPVIQRLGPYARLLLGWVIGAIAWLAPGLTHIQQHLAKMERLQQEAEDAQALARNNDPRIVAAERRVREAEAATAAAETGLAQAKGLEQRLIQAVDDLLPERRLTRFIEARARSADYRGQLGLVSLARRDFQELSDIFTDREALDAKKATLQPKEAAALEKLGASIDRIVLFVDDLDRCRADKVVDVLQAVHLLLAFPLFAVVVGVDQRVLRQSLRTQFSGLVSGERLENGDGAAAIFNADERPATPLDYLEKIFHVPFHLQPMKKEGFADLMAALTRPRQAPSAATAAASSQSIPADADSATRTAATTSQSPVTGTSALAAGGGFSTNPSDPIGATPASPPPIKTIGSVPLQEWERTAVKDYHSLVRTPRGATRFLNTYRLLRASLDHRDWAEFRGDGQRRGEFRVAMLLLASAAGHPAVARDWFQLLREKALHEVQVSEVEADAHGWEHFKAAYESTIERGATAASRETVVKWIERVEQFAF